MQIVETNKNGRLFGYVSIHDFCVCADIVGFGFNVRNFMVLNPLMIAQQPRIKVGTN